MMKPLESKRARAYPLIGLIFAAALSLWMTGCATIERFEKPRVQVVETRLASLDRESMQLTVVLNVENPNSREISLTDIKAKLFLADTEIADATTTQKQIRLAGNGHATVPLRVDVAYKKLPIALQRGIISLMYGSLPYRITGSVTTNNGLLTMPFEHAGEISEKR